MHKFSRMSNSTSRLRMCGFASVPERRASSAWLPLKRAPSRVECIRDRGGGYTRTDIYHPSKVLKVFPLFNICWKVHKCIRGDFRKKFSTSRFLSFRHVWTNALCQLFLLIRAQRGSGIRPWLPAWPSIGLRLALGDDRK